MPEGEAVGAVIAIIIIVVIIIILLTAPRKTTAAPQTSPPTTPTSSSNQGGAPNTGQAPQTVTATVPATTGAAIQSINNLIISGQLTSSTGSQITGNETAPVILTAQTAQAFATATAAADANALPVGSSVGLAAGVTAPTVQISSLYISYQYTIGTQVYTASAGGAGETQTNLLAAANSQASAQAAANGATSYTLSNISYSTTPPS